MMKLLMNELLNQTTGNELDSTRNKLCSEDETYLQDENDLNKLTKRYTALNLPKHDRMIINDYIACLQTADSRYADISYIAGVEDAITWLAKMGFIKANA